MYGRNFSLSLLILCLVAGGPSFALDYQVHSQANTFDLGSTSENLQAKVVTADVYTGVPYKMYIPDENPPVTYNSVGDEFEGVFVGGVTGTSEDDLTWWHRSVLRAQELTFPIPNKIQRKFLFMVDHGNLVDNSGEFTVKLRPTAWGDLPTLPIPMYGTITVVDPATGKVYVFGGGCGNPGPWYNSTWVFNPHADINNGWAEIPASNEGPEPRYFGSGIYDPNPSGDPRMVIYGGQTATPNKYDDTWALNLNTYEWTELPTTNNPPAGVQHSAAFDPNPEGTRRMLLRNGDVGATTYALNLETYEWTILPQVGGPGNRGLSTIQVYYPSVGNPQLLQFGGGYLSVYYDDLWSMDLVTGEWTELPKVGPAGTPVGREGHVSAIDPVKEKLTIWGGRTLNEDLSDLWYYDLIDQAWVQVSFPSDNWPEARHAVSAAYDPTYRAFIITAGITLEGGQCTDEPVCKVFITDYTDFDYPAGAESEPLIEPVLLRSRAWPNPSELGATIHFATRETNRVSGLILDVNGRVIRDLGVATLSAGEHRLEWDRTADGGARVPPGSYFYKLRVGKQVSSGKIVLVE
ncbi:MAG: hypothetical protein GF355_04955 [Candidatus Eisenbacteria bacterium]|nr:hypothetical protein [Candidatus Eisenbacteria bacterium]